MVISRLGGDIYRIMLRARQGLLFFGMVEDWIALELAGLDRKTPQGFGSPLEIDEALIFLKNFTTSLKVKVGKGP